MTLSEKQIAHAVKLAYEKRRDRKTHPEGRTDSGNRWYPSAREDADGDGTSTRSPSRAWPWSYAHRCRTRAHVKVLVLRAVEGFDVPEDIHVAVKASMEEL